MHPSRPQTPVCFARVHASSQVPFRKSCLLFATPLLSRRLGRIQPLTRRSGTSAPSPRRALGRSSCHEDIKFLTESATLLGNGSVKQPSARERERKEDENREMNAGSSCKAGRGLRTHWHRSIPGGANCDSYVAENVSATKVRDSVYGNTFYCVV